MGGKYQTQLKLELRLVLSLAILDTFSMQTLKAWSMVYLGRGLWCSDICWHLKGGGDTGPCPPPSVKFLKELCPHIGRWLASTNTQPFPIKILATPLTWNSNLRPELQTKVWHWYFEVKFRAQMLSFNFIKLKHQIQIFILNTTDFKLYGQNLTATFYCKLISLTTNINIKL